MKKILLLVLATLFVFSAEIQAGTKTASGYSFEKRNQRKSSKSKKFKPKKAVKKKVPFKHKDPAYK